MNTLELMDKAVRCVDILDGWKAVPGRVVARLNEIEAGARKVASAYRSDERVYWHPERDQTWVYDPATLPDPYDYGWVLVKAGTFLAPVADAFRNLQIPMNGPNPLTSTLVGGAIGGGLGYGAGALAELALPEQHRRGPLRNTLGMVGAGLGMVPGATWGAVNMQNPEQTGGGLASWLSKWPRPLEPMKAACVPSESFVKACSTTGVDYMPTIPVDAFNNVLWSDVVQAPNPFGTKSPWGTNEQPLGTPAPVAATISGILAGASAATRQPIVSPAQVGLAAAVSGGKGYLAGLAFGKLLGAFAGMDDETQQHMKQLGLWGGALTGAVRELFN